MDNLITILSIIALTSTIFYAMFRVSKYACLLVTFINAHHACQITSGRMTRKK